MAPLPPRPTDSSTDSVVAQPLLDVFLVDDDQAARCGVVRLLQRHGARVTVFDRAEPALVMARSAPPHLVVIDLDLPGMTGFEAAEALKDDRATDDVPVLVLSRRGDSRTRTAAFAVGVDAFLAKPCVLDEVLAAAWSLARRGRAARDRRALSAMLSEALASSRRLEAHGSRALSRAPASADGDQDRARVR